MTDTRRDVAERLRSEVGEIVRELADNLYSDWETSDSLTLHVFGAVDAIAAALLRSEGREPDGHCTGSLRDGGVDFIAVRVRDGLHVPQPIGTPVYFGTPSDSPTE